MTRRVTGGLGALLIAFATTSMVASQGSTEPELECRSGSDLPVRFPFDAHVLRAEVLEPAIALPMTAAGVLAAAERWVVRARATQPIYLPDRADEIDLLLHDDDCQPLDRQQLIDRFVTGDTLEIAAFSGPGNGMLEAPGDWIRLIDENTSRGIDTPFEYFATLFDLEGRDSDSERALAMHRIADYLDSEEQFLAVVDAYIDSKRMRKQLRSVYRDLHPER